MAYVPLQAISPMSSEKYFINIIKNTKLLVRTIIFESLKYFFCVGLEPTALGAAIAVRQLL